MLIPLHCPVCHDETGHDVLKEGRDLLVRCTRCGDTRHEPIPHEPVPMTVKVIVSREGNSQTCQAEIGHDEMLAIGDRLVARCADDYTGVEVAGIEAGTARVTRAYGRDVTTLWTRAIEEVLVRVSVHSGWHTLAFTLTCGGEERFSVGQVITVEGRRIRVTHIKLREGAMLRKDGWATVARRIKRIYATFC